MIKTWKSMEAQKLFLYVVSAIKHSIKTLRFAHIASLLSRLIGLEYDFKNSYFTESYL